MNKHTLFNLIQKTTGYKIYLQKVTNSDPGTDFNKLKNYSKTNKDIKLHFGCGPRVLKGWINIDILYEPYENYLKYYGDEFYPAQIRGTREDFYEFNAIDLGIPLPDNSVDLIFHEDFIEHLNQRDQFIFLAETLRVMKKGAIHRVNTPNIITSMATHSNFSKGANGVYKGEWDDNIHLSVLSQKYLEEIALLIGYSQVIFNGKNQSISKDLPKEYRPSGDRDQTEGNIFADLIK